MTDAKGNSMTITDFHSHVLPMMDDGSQSPEESLKMLKLLRSQGVDRVVATPHFYPKQEDPESFLKRRDIAETMLKSAISFAGLSERDIPEVCIGAEVAYYNGMSLSKDVKKLCIKGTDVMLLEMPFYKWSDTVVNEVCKMQDELGIQIVLAHIDRYLQYADSAKLFKLKTYRVLMQANADPFLRFLSGRKMIKLLLTNQISLMGSDFHNLDTRCSNMDAAVELILERGYFSKLKNIMNTADELLSDADKLV